MTDGLWPRLRGWLGPVAAETGTPEAPGTESLIASIDEQPWGHPFLEGANLAAFREYSEAVWELALDRAATIEEPLDCAFAVNMAQSMYKWATLAAGAGACATLYPHWMDRSAISAPEWEEYDGEFEDIADGDAFLARCDRLSLRVPCVRIAPGDSGLLQALNTLTPGDTRGLLEILAQAPGVRHEALTSYAGFYPYFDWAKALARHSVICAASAPVAAYASGRPYCVLSVGGDLQSDCGRPDDLGRVMLLAFNAARFLLVANPHTLGHARRLGLTNGVYLPYPMDTDRYCPGPGAARREWVERLGEGVYVLTSARIDPRVKGHGDAFFQMLGEVARMRPEVRFVFLAWGTGVAGLRDWVAAQGLGRQVLILPPVGKLRLIDYYRSCDLVLDQFVYGYFGATALEAAAVAKPTIMHLRHDHYAPLYRGDLAPVTQAVTPGEIRAALLGHIDFSEGRAQAGTALRAWLLRHHGQERTTPLLLALLRLAADRVALPEALINPLMWPLSPEERAYHQTRLMALP